VKADGEFRGRPRDGGRLHPSVKQGLVQSFSVYIDTVIVCTATGVMILTTGA
jgi:Na+/alanine symporter